MKDGVRGTSSEKVGASRTEPHSLVLGAMSRPRSCGLDDGLGELRRADEGTNAGVVVHEVNHVGDHASEDPYCAECEGDDLETEGSVGPFSREREEGEVEEGGAEEANENVSNSRDNPRVLDFCALVNRALHRRQMEG